MTKRLRNSCILLQPVSTGEKSIFGNNNEPWQWIPGFSPFAEITV
jgi:hypothetical protein